MKNSRLSLVFTTRALLIAVLLLSSASLSFSQETSSPDDGEKPPFWERLAPGGNFSLQFGTITYVDISPSVGYRFTDRFTAGPGFTYRYLKYRGFPGSSIYGGRFFARHIIARQFFVQTEFESLNTEYYDITTDRLVRGWVPGLFVGGGIYQPIGERAGFMIAALYNLSYDNIRSPYNSPWVFNVGFTF